MKITEITGTITTTDGKVRSFSISTDGVWQQWGVGMEDAGNTVDALEAMSRALIEDGLIASSNDEDDEETAAEQESLEDAADEARWADGSWAEGVLVADEWPTTPKTLGEMTEDERSAAVSRAVGKLQEELDRTGPALGKIMNDTDG